jgi:SAM-dependent methyltransferase
MLQLSFWRAFDRLHREEITRIAGGRRTLLEVGGGTGRVSIPMARHFDLVLSFDLSEGMVRTAMAKRDRGGPALEHLEYFVADAENIPVRSESADIAVLSGILHHVGAPATVVTETARVLRADGRYLGSENNRSAFRPLFDLSMRLVRLWNEKAHEENFIISRDDVRRWFTEAGLSVDTWTSVFLPPHLLTLLPEPQSERVSAPLSGTRAQLPDGQPA